MGSSKEFTIRVTRLEIPNFITIEDPLNFYGLIGTNPQRGTGFILKGQTPPFNFETEFGYKLEPMTGGGLKYVQRLHHSIGTASILFWEVEFSRNPTKSISSSSKLRCQGIRYLDKINHHLSIELDRKSGADMSGAVELELGVGSGAKLYKIWHRLQRHAMPMYKSFEYTIVFKAPHMVSEK